MLHIPKLQSSWSPSGVCKNCATIGLGSCWKSGPWIRLLFRLKYSANTRRSGCTEKVEYIFLHKNNSFFIYLFSSCPLYNQLTNHLTHYYSNTYGHKSDIILGHPSKVCAQTFRWLLLLDVFCSYWEPSWIWCTVSIPFSIGIKHTSNWIVCFQDIILFHIWDISL